MPSFYEFFAGGGMARAGLGSSWECLFANDFNPKKTSCYAANWGSRHLRVEDIGRLTAEDLPGTADLAWASFPCQDLSLAGKYVGLQGERSGTFWRFWSLIQSLTSQGRAPTLIVLENVCGALTSHSGEDFAAIAQALMDGGYRFGALVLDAVRFVPQSRPRLFVVAVREERSFSSRFTRSAFQPAWHPLKLTAAHNKLPDRLKEAWNWWHLPEPQPRTCTFAQIIDDNPVGVKWDSRAETDRLLSMMSATNWKKVEQASRMNRPMPGAIYKRTRLNEEGKRVQRVEVRFDGIAGCLRTPAGGSSRQSVLIVDGSDVRSRLLAPREAARLMGLPESYQLPVKYNDAYHIAGDGVVVPVVRHLSAHLLEPLLSEINGSRTGAEAA